MTEQTQHRKKKVLVADDDPSILHSVKRVLGYSYIVIEASNGQEAVNLALSQKPDIIFMDIMIPEKDDYSACAEIKTNESIKAIPQLTALSIEQHRG